MGRLQRFKDQLEGKRSPEQAEDDLRQKLLDNSLAILKAIETLPAPDMTNLANKIDIAEFKRDLELLNNKKIEFNPKIAAPNLKPILRAVQNIEVSPVVTTNMKPVNDVLNIWLAKIMKQISDSKKKKKFKFEIVREDFSDKIKEVTATEI